MGQAGGDWTVGLGLEGRDRGGMGLSRLRLLLPSIRKKSPILTVTLGRVIGVLLLIMSTLKQFPGHRAKSATFTS